MLMSYYDLLCSREIHKPRKLFGWSQASLRSIQKNRKMGGLSVLEHPMPHVNHWMQINQSFYDDPAFTVKPGYSRFSRGMVRRMLAEYEAADFIDVHSSFARQTFISEGVDPSRIMVTPLGIDASTFPYADDERSACPKLRVGYLGRLELFKGLPMMLPLTQRYHEEIQWTVTGRLLPEIKPFLKNLRHVSVMGNLGRREVSKLLSQTDVLVFPSMNDAFGLVILEAMFHRVPVIASRTSAGPDIISHGEDGYLMDANDTKSIEQGIQWALQNRNRLPEIGARARKKVTDNYLSHHYFQRLNQNLVKVGFTK
jgi:glycosyltransferase involved in cell wall biosynthesis